MLPAIARLVQRILAEQLKRHIRKHSVLPEFQHGFRAHHSTTTALLEMHSNWVQAYEENRITAVVLLDMSAAFDLVDKSILIGKLKLYGLDVPSSTLMESYMSSRYCE